MKGLFFSAMDILEKFIQAVDKHSLFTKGAKILIAVSGGIDSVTLLDLIYTVKDEYNLKLKIIHLNHGIRGEAADRDETFVRQLAQRYYLPIIVKKVNVIDYCDQHKCSLEESARILRFQFFKEALQKSKFDLIALGHNANDQAETILDHLLRGSGIRGLAGMKFKRDQFIRPLLSLTRQEIETYAIQRGLNNVTDATNTDIEFKRNQIRHQLIPVLQKEFNPGIVNVLLKTGAIIREMDLFLEAEAEKAFHTCLKISKKNKIILDINVFLNYFNAVKVYVLYHILNLLSIQENSLSFVQTDKFLTFVQKRKSGSRFLLLNNWEILIDHDELVIYQPDETKFEIAIDIGKSYLIYHEEKILKIDLLNKAQLPESFSNNRNIEYIDFQKVKLPLIIRNYRPGDRFIPLNMNGHKKVSDFFTDQKLPLHIRHEIPLLTCPTGIIWIVGYRIDDRFKITPNTKKILKMEIKEGMDDR